MPEQLFVFMQFEFPWVLGPADGRYLVRRVEDDEPEHVVVLNTLAAERQPGAAAGAGAGDGSWLRPLRGRARTAPTGPEPAPVPTTRVTVIDPISLGAESQARAWLEELDREREIGLATAVVNRVVHAHRIAAADPYAHEITPAQALVIRAGWGEGEQVADGRWLHARALPWREGSSRAAPAGASRRRPRRDRASALRPQERLAALLGVRSTPLLCEEIALRARQDIDNARPAHAALELERAYELAVAELREENRQELAIRLTELEQLRASVQAQAQAAQEGAAARAARAGVGVAAADEHEPDEEVLRHALERLEAALRARTMVSLAR
jgi:hypothetical protein